MPDFGGVRVGVDSDASKALNCSYAAVSGGSRVAMRIAFLRQAIALGQHGRRIGEGNPTGAVVVKRGKVFAAAWDRVAITKDPTAHAEVLAIRRACKRLGSHELPDCELYISAEPCPMCIGAVHWAKPRAVYYVNTPL